MQDFQGFARMLRGSSGIKEFASGLQNPAGVSSNFFALADVLSVNTCRHEARTHTGLYVRK